MKLTAKKKNELLNYAIERINQYDISPGSTKVLDAWHDIPKCKGCSLVKEDCSICPFNIDGDSLGACRGNSQYRKTSRRHQNDLIKAVNRWCEKFYPKFKVVKK